MSQFPFNDFSGGISDKTVPGATNRYQVCDNLLIDGDKKLIQREGFDIYASDAYQLAAAERVARLVSFDNDSEILAFQNKKAFAISAGTWAEVTGPGGGSSTTRAFNSNSASSLVDIGEWQHHLYAANNPGGFTATVTIASPGVWTSTAHGLTNGTALQVATTGALPTGFSVNTTYYVVSTAANTFQLAATVGGTAINTSGSQSGTHTVTPNTDPVIKIYRDSSATMRLRTAGLPEWTESLTPADGGLANAITLVNDLRTKMISHYQSNGALSTGGVNNSATGHHFDDAGGLLDGQATDAAATTAATTLGTLITLLNSLRGIYSRHIEDAQKEDQRGAPNLSSVYNRKYHYATALGGYLPHTSATVNTPIYYHRHYLNFTIADPAFTIPSGAVIADVLPYLNDLRDKWNWHTYAPLTHINGVLDNGTEYYTQFGIHATAVAKVEPYTWASIAPNMGPFIQFVKDLHTEFLAHRTNDMHQVDDIAFVPPSAVSTTPTTFTDAITLLGWLAYGITYHALEPDDTFCANGTLGWEQRTASTTSGAATLSLDGVGGFTADKYKGVRVVPLVGTGSTPYSWNLYYATSQATPLICSSSTTATPCVLNMDGNFTATTAGLQFVVTSLRYHIGKAASTLFDHRDLVRDWDALEFRIRTAAELQGFADLAQRLAGYLKSHTIARLTPNASTVNSVITINSKTYTWYKNGLVGGATSATGYDIIVHAGQDNTNYPVSVAAGYIYLSLNSALTAANTAATQMAEDRFDTAPTAASFNYKAVFKYDYTVGSTSFTDRGAPSTAINVIGFVNEDYGGLTETGKHAATLSNIYAFANAANENWDTADTTNFRKEIYRTKANGSLYYKVNIDDAGGDITNATTSLSDYSSDTFLADQLALYTNDGSPENNKPPLATNVHVYKDVMYYVLGNKVYQSSPNDPDSVPADFFEEFEENIVAVSSARTSALAFGSNRVFRLIGGFDDLGRGSLTHETIFDKTGAISAQSVVKADNGVFFAGEDGFYFTDGFQCIRVTDLEDTFRDYTTTAAKRNRIQGTFDNISKKIYWTVQETAASNPDTIWVLDLQFGVKPDATPITKFKRTKAFANISTFNPTALAFYGGILHYGDADGYVYKQTLDRKIDLVKDTSVAATSWAAETVEWNFKSCDHDYGNPDTRKYFTRVSAQFEQQSTNVSAQIVSDADKGRVTGNLPVIRSRKLVDWEGDSNGKLTWISSVYPARAGSLVDEWRRFNGDGSLRSNYRAIQIKTAYCVIVASKDMGTVTIANVAGNVYSVTLTSLVATRSWPLYSVGYYLRISDVDYPITVRTSDSVVRIDSTGLTAPTVGVVTSWEVFGYPKNERVRLLGYTVDAAFTDQNQSASQGPVTTGGENA